MIVVSGWKVEKATLSSQSSRIRGLEWKRRPQSTVEYGVREFKRVKTPQGLKESSSQPPTKDFLVAD